MSMRRLAQILVVVGFLAFISVPLVLTVAGQRPGSTDNRSASQAPDIDAVSLFDTKTYVALDAYLSDRFSLRGLAIRANAKANELIWKGDRGDVRRGTDGWLYYGPSLTRLCTETTTTEQGVAILDRFARGLEGRGVTFRYLLAPEKTTVYPEHLTDRLRNEGACGRQALARLRAELGDPSRPWYVDLFGPVEALKRESAGPVYHERDTHWTEQGAALLARQVVDSLDPSLWDPRALVPGGPTPFEPDLTRLLGLPQTIEIREYAVERPGVTTTAGSETPVDGAPPIERFTSTSTGTGLIGGRTVVLYDSFGIPAIDLLAPYFADVAFVHWNDLGSPEAEAALDGAGTVVAEGAEREFTWRTGDKLGTTGLAERWPAG